MELSKVEQKQLKKEQNLAEKQQKLQQKLAEKQQKLLEKQLKTEQNLEEKQQKLAEKQQKLQQKLAEKQQKLEQMQTEKLAESNNKRTACECNGFEWLLSVLLVQPTVVDIPTLLQTINDSEKIQCEPSDKILYVNNLMKMIETPKCAEYVNKSIQNFRTAVVQYHSCDNIEYVLLPGKHAKAFPELNIINGNIGDRKIMKADIYAKTTTGSYFGYSVKQTDDATKSNWSLYRVFEKGGMSEQQISELVQIKQDYFAGNGLIPKTESERKSARDAGNYLLSGKNNKNPYFEALRQHIEVYKVIFKQTVIECLFCGPLQYPMYEFNGSTVVHLNQVVPTMEDIVFEEYLDYYKLKNGNMRDTAKIYYKLKVLDHFYRVEVRFKGELFTGTSPQFLIHEDVEIVV